MPKNPPRQKIVLLITTGISLFFLCGWQNIDLTEYLQSKKEEVLRIEAESEKINLSLNDFPCLTPYKILQKTTRSFYGLKTVIADIEVWLESPLFHIKSNFKQEFQTADNYKTEGRVSASVIIPNGVSSSNWVQAYKIKGLPFTWDLKNREWKEEELNISAEDTRALRYSLLSSLFTINESSLEPQSIEFAGIHKRNGRNCFVLKYKLAPEMFNRWAMSGNVNVKAWIDTENFYPLAMRIEGKISDIYILQIVNYSQFNTAAEFSLPAVISERIKKEKDKLMNKTDELVDNIAAIRGYHNPKKINVEFLDRSSLLENVTAMIDKEYSQERIEAEEFIYKWLGLLPRQADYKDTIINSQVSQMAAYYDPEKKKIFLGEWVHPVFAEYILIHEIVHALQDEFLNLDDFIPKGDNWDLSFARSSFVEGEATALMLDYLLRKDGREFKYSGDIFSLIEEEILSQYPYARENILYNLYGFGASFIQTYLNRYNWDELDAVYKSPPCSMKEIIHPEVYLKGHELVRKNKTSKIIPEMPMVNKALSLSKDKVELPAGWENKFNVQLGEFLIMLSLRQELEKDVVEKIVRPWQEDRVSIFENKNKNNQRLVFFSTTWYTAEDAAGFLRIYTDWLKKRYPGINSEDFAGGVLFKTTDNQLFFGKVLENKVNILWVDTLTIEAGKELIISIYTVKEDIL